MVAHHENSRSGLLHRLPVELPGLPVKPLRVGLGVVVERQPERLELPHLLAVRAEAKIDDVRDAERLQSLDVAPTRNGAAKG